MTDTVAETQQDDSVAAAVRQILDQGPASPLGCVFGVDIDGHRSVVAGGHLGPGETASKTRNDTRFDLASVTKVVGTTTALHRLASEGLLSLDAPVGNFVPALKTSLDASIRDLLLHRSGLWEWQPLYLAPGYGDTDFDPMSVLASLPLRYQPGQERHYSDLGFMVLGQVVSSIAGSDLSDAYGDLVAEPLGLSSFAFGPVASEVVAASAFGDAAERQMVATGVPYPVSWPDRGFGWRTQLVHGSVNDGNAFHAFRGVSGHAGLFGTVDDLLNVATALSRADEYSDLWSSAVTAEVFSPGPDPDQALGWRCTELVINGGRMPFLWHPGFTGTAVGFVPGRGIAAAFASNRLLAVNPQPTTVFWQQSIAALTTILTTRE